MRWQWMVWLGLVQAWMQYLNPLLDAGKKALGEKGLTKVETVVDWLAYRSGLGEQCAFTAHPSVDVRRMLEANVLGQDQAIDALVSAIASWEFSMNHAQLRTPLTLALSGPTGTGTTRWL